MQSSWKALAKQAINLQVDNSTTLPLRHNWRIPRLDLGDSDEQHLSSLEDLNCSGFLPRHYLTLRSTPSSLPVPLKYGPLLEVSYREVSWTRNETQACCVTVVDVGESACAVF